MEPGNMLLDDHALALTGRERPRVCFLPTASGDADHYVVRFYRTFAPRADVSHLSLFRRDRAPGSVEGDIRAHLLAQDLIYVGGGSVVSLVGTWRAHGLDAILARGMAGRRRAVRAQRRLAVLVRRGRSPRSTDRRSASAGLGLLPYSNCVHYDEEPERRDHFRDAIATGMPGGYACEDGAALHFVGTDLHDVVSSRPKSRAYRVEPVDGRRGRDRTDADVPRRPEGGAGRGARRVTRKPTILAMGGGGFTMEPDNPALDEFVLTLSDRQVPRLLFLPTASGDAMAQVGRFHATFDDRPCETRVLSIFRLGETGGVPLRDLILAQDIVYVGGGSMRSLLAIWREYELDVILREAWESGVVLAGLSAGAMCWFTGGVTMSTGLPGAGRRARPAARLAVGSRRHRRRPPAGVRGGDPRRPPARRLARRRRRRAAVPRTSRSSASSARVPGRGWSTCAATTTAGWCAPQLAPELLTAAPRSERPGRPATCSSSAARSGSPTAAEPAF